MSGSQANEHQHFSLSDTRYTCPIFKYLLSPEIIRKVKKPPPMCRPTVAPDQAPLECIQLMKQCWSELPDRRPNFGEIFDRVTRRQPVSSVK